MYLLDQAVDMHSPTDTQIALINLQNDKQQYILVNVCAVYFVLEVCFWQNVPIHWLI